MNDFYLAMILKTELIQAPALLRSCMEKYFRDNEFRVYIKDTEFSEWARTFKVVKTKKRSKRK